jgi:sugar (pentulose or hexulose) kinase
MNHGKAEIARATLEGVAFNLGLILDALRENLGAPPAPRFRGEEQGQSPPSLGARGAREQTSAISAMRFIGGGSRSPLWQQILADVFDLPIHVLALQGDATSWGAAVCAGVGVGLYDWSMAGQGSRVEQIVEPDPAASAYYQERKALFAEIYAALKPIYPRLGD